MSDTSVAAKAPSTWVLLLIQGIIAIIIGFLLVSSPVVTTLVLVQVLAWFWIIGGAIGIISLVNDRTMWGLKVFSGIVSILAGLFIVGAPIMGAAVAVSVYILFLAVTGLIRGGMAVFGAFKGGGWGMGLLGALDIVISALLLANLGVATLIAPLVFGWIALIGGVVAFIMAFVVRGREKKMVAAAA